MRDLHFEWDARKAASNHLKHGVSFEEAETVFRDEQGLLLNDPDHSENEARFVLIGLSSALRVTIGGETMRKEYDFSKARPNPYAKRLKRQVTIRLDQATIDYFKALAERSEIPYQTLINLYLRECAASGKRPHTSWRPSKIRGAA